jgi:hypothetical protein
LKELDFFLHFIRRLPELPPGIMSAARDAPADSMRLCKLLFIYSNLHKHGYIVKGSFEWLLDAFSISDARVDTFMRAIVSSVQSDVKDNKASFRAGKNVITDLVLGIKPFQEADPFSEASAFNVAIPFELPLHAYLDDIDAVFERNHHKGDLWSEHEIERIDNYSDYFTDVTSKRLAEKIQVSLEDGKCSRELPPCLALEKANPANPVAYYIHEQCIDGLPESQRSVFIKEMPLLIQKAIELSRSRPFVDFFLEMTHIVNICGYFTAAYILSNTLLRFMPLDFDLHVISAYCAYQLRRPFHDDLFRASLLDPERLVNFILKYWMRMRVPARDSLDTYSFTKEGLETLETAKARAFQAPFKDKTLKKGMIDLLGAEFPFESVLGMPLEGGKNGGKARGSKGQ